MPCGRNRRIRKLNRKISNPHKATKSRSFISTLFIGTLFDSIDSVRRKIKKKPCKFE